MRFLALALLSLTFSLTLQADPIKIGIKDFGVISENTSYGWRGVEPDLFFEATVSQNLLANGDGYEVIEFSDVAGVLNAVKSGKVDVGFGGISITSEREKEVDFSLPTYNSGLKVMVDASQGEGGVLSRIVSFTYPKQVASTLTKPEVAEMGFWLFLYVIIWAHVIWFIERGEKNFHDSYFKGVGQGLRFVVVTISTVGYGNDVVKKALSWVFVALLMFTGINFFCSYTALQAAEMTNAERQYAIKTIDDLQGKRVGTKSGSSSHRIVDRLTDRPEFYSIMADAKRALLDGEIDAIVFDAPILDDIANKDERFAVIKGLYVKKEDYGFVFPEGSELKEKINRRILAAKENGFYDAAINKYF